MSTFDQFLDEETSFYKRVAEKVAHDPLIFAGLKKWDVYDDKEKVSFLERYARLLADEMTMGFSPEIELYQKAGYQVDGKLIFEGGHFTGKGNGSIEIGNGIIRINTYPAVLSGATLKSQLDLIAHEMAHKRQKDMTENPNYAGKKYKATVPELFRKNFDHYISPEDDPAAYFKQPVEVHAYAMGEAAASAILEFASKRDALPGAPYKDSSRRLEFQMNGSSNKHVAAQYLPSGVIEADPNVHYWAARSAEVKLAQPRYGIGNNASDWFSLIQNYKMAVNCGEFVSFNLGSALEGLYNIAHDNVLVERPGQDARLLKVPPNYQKMARDALEKFAQSPVDRLRIAAKTHVKKLDAHEKRMQKQQPAQPVLR